MTKVYDPNKIEAKWRQKWVDEGIYDINESGDGEKMYVLGMFPYPSGDGLHVGHVRVFAAVDVMSRYFRMKGKRVLMPMGWDSFGLPAENAAIKRKTNPMDMVPKNEANFRRQFEMIGASYDWNRCFSTTDPGYYKWTQWLFLQLYSLRNDKGERLVYKSKVAINWCPFCKTGLANEEVLADGTHERCGNKVEQRLMSQWVMGITDYADRLLADLEGLDWPRGILEMQRNWIGRSEGIEIDYPLVGSDKKITCFTTTPVNFGATFVVLAPEHPLVAELEYPEEYKEGVKRYVDEATRKTEMMRKEGADDKTGVFSGLYVVNQLTGEEIPVWIADFVLRHVGTGAVQGCPGHDRRDFQFALRYGISIKRVVVGEDGDESEIDSEEKIVEKGMKGKMVSSDFLNGLEFAEAMEKTMDYFEKKGWGRRVVKYHLRDWVFSRQRYWGEPFPLIYCGQCGDENGVVEVPESELPVKLPYLESYEPTETGESPLSTARDWVEVKCPRCGGEAKRETDTMPNWAGSCWYFLYFGLNRDEMKKVGGQGGDLKKQWQEVMRPKIDKMLPVDWYLGGAEHAVLHLLYARFWVKAFSDLGLLAFKEPFTRLRDRGTVLADDGRKMSKSWGNVVNPDDIVAKFGADSLRVYEMFMGPWGQAIAWDTRSLVGCYRFLEKVWKLYQHSEEEAKESRGLKMELKSLVVKVGKDIEVLKFNTAVAAMMEFVNLWSRQPGGLDGEDKKMLIKIMAPFAPFMAEELWMTTGETGSVHQQGWPEVEDEMLRQTKVIVQVNGKMRGVLEFTIDEAGKAGSQDKVEEAVKRDGRIAKWLEGKKYRAVFVPGKVVNFVVDEGI